MKLLMKPSSGGVEITCIVNDNVRSSYWWSSPPPTIDDADEWYLNHRYPCLETREDIHEFKKLYKQLMGNTSKDVRIMQCNCGAIEGKKRLPNSHSSFGLTIKEMPEDYDGVFVNNKALYLENNFCPQCGTPLIVGNTSERGRT